MIAPLHLPHEEINRLAADPAPTPDDRDRLVRAHMPLVFREVALICSGTAMDRDDAEGAALLGIAEALAGWRPELAGRRGHITGWIHLYVRARLINMFNREHVPQLAEISMDELRPYGSSRPDVDSLVVEDLLAKTGLTDEEQRVVELYALNSNSLREAAELLDMSRRRCRRLWESARDKLLAEVA